MFQNTMSEYWVLTKLNNKHRNTKGRPVLRNCTRQYSREASGTMDDDDDDDDDDCFYIALFSALEQTQCARM